LGLLGRHPPHWSAPTGRTDRGSVELCVVCVFSVCYVILRVRIELYLRTFCRDMGPPVRLSGRVFAVWGRTVLSTGIFIHSFIQ
jgi:hypothetical protein